jgi:hypothetical protein
VTISVVILERVYLGPKTLLFRLDKIMSWFSGKEIWDAGDAALRWENAIGL